MTSFKTYKILDYNTVIDKKKLLKVGVSEND